MGMIIRNGVEYCGYTDVKDNLSSNSATSALSAKQGKVLNENKISKVASPTADNLVSLTASGDIADSGIAKGDVIQSNENLLDNSRFNVCERLLNYYLPPNGTYWETPWSNTHTNDTGDYIPLKKTGSNIYDLVINGVTYVTTETATNHIIKGFAEVGYTVNRWRTWHATTIVDITNKGITIINNGTATYLFTQYLEQRLVDLLRGQKVTLSVELQNGTVVKETGTVPNSGSYTLIADGTDIKLRMVIATLSYCDFYVDGTKEIHNAKLEIGGTCTILLDAPRPYAEELARCQTSTADVNDTYANKGNIVTSNSIAPTEDGATASKEYVVGEPFFRGGDYCVCISAIANGGTFTLNTNYKKIPLGEMVHGWKDITSDVTWNNTDFTYSRKRVLDDGKTYFIAATLTSGYQASYKQLLTGLPKKSMSHCAVSTNTDKIGGAQVYIDVNSTSVNINTTVTLPTGNHTFNLVVPHAL